MFYLDFLATAALSTRFGYRLPAALARALALLICAGVNFLEVFLGFFLSQNAVFFFIIFFPCYV